MLYLIPIPIILVAVIVKVLSVRYKLKIFSFLSSVVIVLGVVYFIYEYANYNGYNIIEIVKGFFKF